MLAARSAAPDRGARLAFLGDIRARRRSEDVPAVPDALARARDGRGAVRVVFTVLALLFAISAPYIISSPGSFVTDLLYSAGKLPGGLSWQVVLHGLPASVQVGIGAVLLGVFVAAAIALAFVDDLTVAAAATMVIFLLLSKQVIEQYLIWPLPFLVLLATGRRSLPAWLLIGELTAAGMITNAYFHPFGLQPAVLNVALALLRSATLARLLAERTRTAARRRPRSAPDVEQAQVNLAVRPRSPAVGCRPGAAQNASDHRGDGGAGHGAVRCTS